MHYKLKELSENLLKCFEGRSSRVFIILARYCMLLKEN